MDALFFLGFSEGMLELCGADTVTMLAPQLYPLGPDLGAVPRPTVMWNAVVGRYHTMAGTRSTAGTPWVLSLILGHL